MEEDACNMSLVLGLGRGDFVAGPTSERRSKPPVQFHLLFPPSDMSSNEDDGSSSKNLHEDEEESANKRSHSNERNSTRKKLRLSKQQSSLLEESFKEHNTLTPVQKQELAERLNLRPRQVEVWFQNRRARTKLKQTEVDCSFLKKCCESLSDENRRLKKELQELRSIKIGSPFYLQLSKAAAPATTLTMCPSCERATTNGGKIVKNQFHSSMKDSSMAC
ncbi:homeobox-leucine zipper protein HAT14-like [Magnolia sinica]|uniref:homeobox-leucine zipper protein HAT14-like n=1 Tax=Magnolia sinica TaxID=86752 RepID=UPI00265A2232|nr:homeobox-leucine zipper protein HAT14-like [Magnolia sinica]